MFASILPMVAATSSGSSSGSAVTSLLFLVLMVGALYMLMIRPQQRRARAQRALQQGVEEGDEVVTIGGMYGTVTEVDDDNVTIEVADNIELRFVRSAIARKLVYDDDDQYEDEAEEEPEEQEADEAK